MRKQYKQHLGCPNMQSYIWILLAILISGCALTYRDTLSSDPRYNPHRAAPTFKMMRTVTYDPIPSSDSGAFYIMQSDGDNPLPSKPITMIQDLYTRGFDITHVWILERWDCDRPRSNRMTTGTIYYPFLLIHMGHPDEAIVSHFKFHPVSRRGSLACPHYVREDLASQVQ